MTFPQRSFFEEVYRGPAPWDVEAAQPDLMELLEAFPPEGPVLDLGCGTGDLALELARRGHTVLGIDFVEAAVAIARERAGALPPDARARVRFEVADALRPSAYLGRAGSAVDSGFFHLFGDEQRRRLVDELAGLLPAGGRWYMLGFAVALPAPDLPRQVTAEEIAGLFSPERGWRVLACRAAGFLTRGFGSVPSLAVCAERTGGGGA